MKRKSRKRRLEELKKRIDKLELANWEFDMRYKEEYINQILNRYAPLISFLCSGASERLRLNFVDCDDCKQEFLEYLLKWTYIESKRRILDGGTEVWVPFIKRSFRNFIINFQNYYKVGGKRRPLGGVLSISDLEAERSEEFSFAESGGYIDELCDGLELKNYIDKFRSNLVRRIDKRVFGLLFFPSESFVKFNVKNSTKLRSFDIIAKYLNYSYASISASYVRIKRNFIGGLEFS